MEEKGIVKEYFSYLAFDASEEEFSYEVKSIAERENNEWLVNRIESELKEKMTFLEDLAKDNPNANEIEKSIEQLSTKMGILHFYLDRQLDNFKVSESLEKEKGSVKLVFARNNAGNIMFLRNLGDIKKYSEDKYALAISFLDNYIEGSINSKRLSIRGMYEISGFNVHIIYMREGEYVVIVGASINSDDNDIKYLDSVINMRRQSEDYRLDLRNGVLDLEEELEKAKEYCKTLNGTLERRVKNG